MVYLKKNPISFHNRSDYDYHFIIKELAKEFKKQFTCLRKNRRIDKNGEEITKNTLTYYNLLIAYGLWQAHY